jgi:ElaB/YqjD/DUF883 family membrane-anchored ribosome-binding protein
VGADRRKKTNNPRMEVFFNNLASSENAAEKLLQDLSRAEEDAEELFAAEGDKLAARTKEVFLSRLEKVKATCRDLQGKAVAGAKVADRVAREHPYSMAGVAFGLGLVVGALMLRRGGGSEEEEE